jgi:hypothetical protein
MNGESMAAELGERPAVLAALAARHEEIVAAVRTPRAWTTVATWWSP